MLVFPDENLVILAVPKTGTTALAGVLAPRAGMVLRDPPHLKHTPCRRYNRFLRPLLARPDGQAPELMAVVRHPVDWLGSWYRYRTRAALAGHPNSTRDVTFDDFVLEYCKDQSAPFAAVGSQNKFLRAGDGELGVDHLFRYEAWGKVIGFLEDRLQMTVTLKDKNVSPKMDVVLSADVEARLRQQRAEEFEIWELGRS